MYIKEKIIPSYKISHSSESVKVWTVAKCYLAQLHPSPASNLSFYCSTSQQATSTSTFFFCSPSWQHSAQSHFCITSVKGFIVPFGTRTNPGRTNLANLAGARPELFSYQLLLHCFLKPLGVSWIVAAMLNPVHNCLFQTHQLQQSPLNPHTETGRQISSIW